MEPFLDIDKGWSCSSAETELPVPVPLLPLLPSLEIVASPTSPLLLLLPLALDCGCDCDCFLLRLLLLLVDAVEVLVWPSLTALPFDPNTLELEIPPVVPVVLFALGEE